MTYLRDDLARAAAGAGRADWYVRQRALDELVAASEAIGALRGVTSAAADVSECTCPEMCERDHDNE